MGGHICVRLHVICVYASVRMKVSPFGFPEKQTLRQSFKCK